MRKVLSRKLASPCHPQVLLILYTYCVFTKINKLINLLGYTTSERMYCSRDKYGNEPNGSFETQTCIRHGTLTEHASLYNYKTYSNIQMSSCSCRVARTYPLLYTIENALKFPIHTLHLY